MSYRMEIFSPQEKPLLKEQLKAVMKRRGFAIAFCAYDYKIKDFASDEAPLDDEIIVACDISGSHVEQFKEIVQARDVVALNEMIAANQVYSCVLSSHVPYEADEEEIEELLEDSDPEYIEALQKSSSFYSLRVNISTDGAGFAAIVWRAIGEIVGGMLEDGQEGTIEFITLDEA